MVALQTLRNLLIIDFSGFHCRYSNSLEAGELNWFLACTNRQNLTDIFQIVSLVCSLSSLVISLISFGWVIYSRQLETLCFYTDVLESIITKQICNFSLMASSWFEQFQVRFFSRLWEFEDSLLLLFCEVFFLVLFCCCLGFDSPVWVVGHKLTSDLTEKLSDTGLDFT